MGQQTNRIPILHEGAGFVVVDKPAGVLSHVHSIDRESPVLVELLQQQLGKPVFTVHRLDRMTTGAMVLATEKPAAAALSRQFADHQVTKSYLAIVRGHTEKWGTVTIPLPHRTSGEESDAHTEYRRIATCTREEPLGRYAEAWFSLVELTLRTGRTHQARRHMRRLHHPVLGDKRHGDNDYNRWARPLFGAYLFLRAVRLSFINPGSSDRIVVHAGLDETWLTAIAALFPAASVQADATVDVQRTADVQLTKER